MNNLLDTPTSKLSGEFFKIFGIWFFYFGRFICLNKYID